MYSVIYSNMSIEAFASYNIAISVQNICLTIFTSLGIACSIMVGNKIGANENDRARNYSVNFIAISVLLSLIISLMVIQLRVYIVGFYNLDDITKEYLYRLLLVIAGFLMVRAVNIIFMIGILKAGGDTMFSMLVDVGRDLDSWCTFSCIFCFLFETECILCYGICWYRGNCKNVYMLL